MSSFWHKLRFRYDHRWTPVHMSAYIDSDLWTLGRARLERHTAECPECRGLLDEVRNMLALLHSAPPPEPVADASAIAGAVLLRLRQPAEY